MKTIVKIMTVAILMLIAASSASAQTLTITMRNGDVHEYDLTVYTIKYVGGEWQSATGEGVKIYRNGATASDDFLYSQMSSFVITGIAGTVDAPVFSPDGGAITGATTVTVTCATGGATIYYTVNGSEPSSSNFAGTGSSGLTLTVSATTTVKAIAVKDGTSSDVTTVTFTLNSSETNNNVNANWWSSNYTKNNGSMSYTPKTAGFYRLEFPHISDDNTTSWVQKSASSLPTLALEWDNTLKANRWTCYQMYSNNWSGSAGRNENFTEDTELPSSTRSTAANYKSSGFSRGHLCPSADRQLSVAQNQQTFFLSNMQPQYQGHNGYQWEHLEGNIRDWAGICDTLYVVKAGTIGDVTLNGTKQTGLRSEKCNNALIVPKYFYMAVLAYTKSTKDSGDGNYYGTFHAMGIWTYHYSSSSHTDLVNAEYITIDVLEARTGIDFFCNLPDDIEAEVEAAAVDETFWKLDDSYNKDGTRHVQ